MNDANNVLLINRDIQKLERRLKAITQKVMPPFCMCTCTLNVLSSVEKKRRTLYPVDRASAKCSEVPARVTLFSHIFTELQFHHHSFITLGSLSFFFRMRCFKRLQRCTSTIKKNCNTRYEDYCHRLEKPAENQAMLYIQQYLIATEGHCCACYSCDH